MNTTIEESELDTIYSPNGELSNIKRAVIIIDYLRRLKTSGNLKACSIDFQQQPPFELAYAVVNWEKFDVKFATYIVDSMIEYFTGCLVNGDFDTTLNANDRGRSSF